MKLSILFTAAALSAAATPAEARLLQYTLTGTDTNGKIEFASFQIDDQPVILPGNFQSGQGFRVKFVAGTFRYGDTVKAVQDVVFGNAATGGGFFTLETNDPTGDTDFLDVVASQLYTGPESAPTLITGDFAVNDTFSFAPLRLQVTAAVPEPATWGMMIAGFAAVGGALRRRRAGALATA